MEKLHTALLERAADVHPDLLALPEKPRATADSVATQLDAALQSPKAYKRDNGARSITVFPEGAKDGRSRLSLESRGDVTTVMRYSHGRAMPEVFTVSQSERGAALGMHSDYETRGQAVPDAQDVLDSLQQTLETATAEYPKPAAEQVGHVATANMQIAIPEPRIEE